MIQIIISASFFLCAKTVIWLSSLASQRLGCNTTNELHEHDDKHQSMHKPLRSFNFRFFLWLLPERWMPALCHVSSPRSPVSFSTSARSRARLRLCRPGWEEEGDEKPKPDRWGRTWMGTGSTRPWPKEREKETARRSERRRRASHRNRRKRAQKIINTRIDWKRKRERDVIKRIAWKMESRSMRKNTNRNKIDSTLT